MKRVLAIIVGAVMGMVLIWLAYPYISDWLVGSVHGEDQMSANFILLLVGPGIGCFVGGLAGGLAYSRLKKR
ncbi:hypothetical protein [Serratia rubidaea]|uniref:hypothetical protein n=1 Tax=Serratia rubidaea TaxID=61652 RepID=UPI00077324A8|nr:hypothetical protein [Serratia rubidaea]